MSATKNCIVCSKTFRGRSDKKFCSLNCKNDFHYQKKSSSSIVQQIDSILHKNRNVLLKRFEKENPEKTKIYTSKIQLTMAGFNFSYYTSTYLNIHNKRYFYIYDFAWMEFSLEEIMVVRKKN